MNVLVRMSVTNRYRQGKTKTVCLVRHIRNPNAVLENIDELELRNKIQNNLVTKNNFEKTKEVIFTHEIISDNNTNNSYISIDSYSTEVYEDRDQILKTLLDKMYVCFNISNEMILEKYSH